MAHTNVSQVKDHTNETRRLATLLEISQALSGVLNLKAALHSVLDILERRHQVAGGTVMLVDRDSRDLHVEASGGIRLPGHRARGRSDGNAMTERVIDSAKPIVVPRVSQEPNLGPPPERGRGERELSYLVVPILLGRKPAGTIEVALPYKADRDFQRSLEFYRVVASMIAQAIKVSRMVEADRHRLTEENEHLRDELRERYAFRNIIGNSAPIQQVYEQVAQVARTNTTVLIRGESGTGKEMVAHAIHYNSPRAKKPFIKVSAAALPDSLIESELFGYERGAFTGAQGSKKGRFELAEGGTLFLDEIGDLRPELQAKLLRAIQEGEIERIGSQRPVRTDFRLIAATHVDLEKAMKDGRFREDLFYRLNVVPLKVPPLRERAEDIPELARFFLRRYNTRFRKQVRGISEGMLRTLQAYWWPGNIRELENLIERLVAITDKEWLTEEDLPFEFLFAQLDTQPSAGSSLFEEACRHFERTFILRALEKNGWNVTGTARYLGLPLSTLKFKMDRLEVRDLARKLRGV